MICVIYDQDMSNMMRMNLLRSVVWHNGKQVLVVHGHWVLSNVSTFRINMGGL